MAKKTSKKTALALAALGTMSFAGLANANMDKHAADGKMENMDKMGQVAKMEMKMEKCSIVGPDGKTMLLLRDCASSAHSCAGKASDPGDWILMPKGTCKKIKGGSVVHEK